MTLDDRAKDNWAMLFRIAKAAGGGWPNRALEAARVTSGKFGNEKQAVSIQLLGDIRRAFDDLATDSIRSDALASRLGSIEEAPWGALGGGKPLSPRGIALMLKPFGISPNKRKDANYYIRRDFEDAWLRYL